MQFRKEKAKSFLTHLKFQIQVNQGVLMACLKLILIKYDNRRYQELVDANNHSKMTIEEKLEQGYFAGCIKYKNEYGFYLMPIAYWILNMNTYDPDYDPSEDEFVFRNNVEVVTDEKILDFFNAIEDYRISYRMLQASSLLDIVFFIDFDVKMFVSYFNDIEVETYLPDSSWKGLFDDPNKYILLNDIKE